MLDEVEFANNWRVAWLDGDPDNLLQQLVNATGAPAMEVFVFDSDLADIQANSPAGTYWHTRLHPAVAEEFGIPPLEQTVEQILVLIEQWSREAGFEVDREAVRHSLSGREITVEDTLLAFLRTLNIKQDQ
ncbi:hypothetical protein [Actinoplanes derwentensis]|uniref:hypothetical protein n=1 Tax=Actinoplanes derwentensis TaxID=113562 RepID=UPI0012FD4208|nr:hypothetical protein [Actinoplanes derwentensis]GID88341.1 hypothetical protein Ade03nite_72650 [Actinoplanes derwentensis]